MVNCKDVVHLDLPFGLRDCPSGDLKIDIYCADYIVTENSDEALSVRIRLVQEAIAGASTGSKEARDGTKWH